MATRSPLPQDQQPAQIQVDGGTLSTQHGEISVINGTKFVTLRCDCGAELCQTRLVFKLNSRVQMMVKIGMSPSIIVKFLSSAINEELTNAATGSVYGLSGEVYAQHLEALSQKYDLFQAVMSGQINSELFDDLEREINATDPLWEPDPVEDQLAEMGIELTDEDKLRFDLYAVFKNGGKEAMASRLAEIFTDQAIPEEIRGFADKVASGTKVHIMLMAGRNVGQPQIRVFLKGENPLDGTSFADIGTFLLHRDD